MKKQMTFVMIGALTLSLLGGVPTTKAEETTDPVVVEINETTFPDARLRANVAAKADTDHDGKLKQLEIAAVKKFSWYPFKNSDDYDEENETEKEQYTQNDFVVDLKGMEYFTSLTELTLLFNGGVDQTVGQKAHLTKVKNFDCVYSLNSLKKLSIYNADLTSISTDKFSSLEKLSLYELDQIKTLKVNSKTIKSLWVEDSALLKTLDLTKASVLKTLVVESNDSLNKISFAKKNPTITKLQYRGNKKIKKLNLNALVKLKTLSLSKSNITALSVDKCKKLSVLTLEQMTKLKTLDLRKNKKLKEFYSDRTKKISVFDLQKNNQLESIWIAGANVKQIRLGKNKISYFRVNDTKLKKMDLSKVNKKTLKEINLYSNKNLKKVDVRAFKNLKTIIVSKNTKVMKRKGTVTRW